MRLFEAEYQQFLKTAVSCGIHHERINFIKRKGWVHIKISGYSDSFQFHRKKVTHISDGKFENSFVYLYKTERRNIDAHDWSEVVHGFKNWCHKLIGR